MQINKDPTIKVSIEQSKQIAQIICKEIKESIASNKKVYDRADRCERQYNQVTKWMQLGKVCNKPWPGAADYFVAMTEWIVDAIWSRLLSILFSQEPYMKAIGTDARSVENQDSATDFVDMNFREKIHLYENTNFFFKQLIKLPFATLKYDWQQEHDNQISREKAMVFITPDGEPEYLLFDDPDAISKSAQYIANGYQPSQPEEVFVLNDVEIYNGPRIQYINANDYIWTSGTKRNEKPYWEGDRCWFTLNEMALKVRQEKFIAETVKRIKDVQLGTTVGNDAIIKQRSTPIECFHWYGRLPFNENNEIDLVNPDAIEQEVYCCVAYKEEELLQIISWPYNRYPKHKRVYIRESYEESTGFAGRSMVEKLYKTQQELNDFHNTLMNNAWISMQKIFAKKKSLQGDEWDLPKVFPGAIWEEEQTGDIRALEIGDVKSIGMEMENLLLGFAERISNISNWNLGATKGQGGKTTATEFAGTIQEGNIGREPLLQRCYKVLTTICEWTLDYYKGRIPPNMERSLQTEQGGREYPNAQNMGKYKEKGINPIWQDEDLDGEYSWKWQGTSLNSDKQWNIMVDNDLMDRYLPHPMISNNLLATWTIMKKGLVDRGIKNWEEILPPKQAIIQEMQNMQQQQQQMQRADQLKGVVKKKLLERGMPAEQIDQAVEGRI